ncbi:hypothetical protein [Azospirillum lipoferum]|uniref:MxaH protein n=1 Tax=Azospirillum lipoferum (strain 4B) TaxID=862719 RepID=G7Z9T4_AZOL4|nr:hypothetical protein [Azospirillum lipoferum]CBS89136.1 conserved protein of unknown function [MoxZ homologue] [Azospirillum lipoferum 4B]
MSCWLRYARGRDCRTVLSAPAALRSGLLLVVLLAAAVACDSQSDGNSSAEQGTAPLEPLPAVSMANKNWLEAGDRTPPEQWLASRAAHADLPLSAPSVAAFHTLLAQADHAYVETPRMIANRVAQLQEMLAGRGMTESADTLIEGFLSLGSDGGSRRFGEDCQHYFNLRSTNHDHRDVLAALRGEAGGQNR